MKNNGKEAERAFVEHWEKVGHVQRLRDKADLIGLNGGAHIADFAKPSDFLVSAPRLALHYAEVKSTTNAVSFSFSKIQKGQNAAALKEATRGDGAYVFYIFSYPLGQWFLMDCRTYAQLVESGVRSIKFKDLPLWYK